MLTDTVSRTEVLIVLLLFSFIVFLLPSIPGHLSDRSCWEIWALHNYTNGLKNSYTSGTNYLPLYQYVLWGYGKIVGNSELIRDYLNNLRAFTLVFDIAGLWLVYRWIDKRWPFYLLVVLNVLNLGYIYNTVIWGQVDGILSTLVFAAIYLACKRQLAWSAVTIILALNFKLQAIVFVPVWGLVFLCRWAETKKWEPLLLSLAAMLLVQAVILFPFMLSKGGLQLIWNVVTPSVGTFPRVSMNAFNFWHLFTTIDTWHTSDETPYIAGISYKKAGFFLFFTSSFIVLWPLLKKTWLQLKGRQVQLLREEVWLTSALIALLFFFVNTQMHERYCHPAFIFMAAYAFYTNRFLAFVLFSLARFLNLEQVLKALHLTNYSTLLFNTRFIAGLYLVVILLLLAALFKRKTLRE